MRVLAACTLLCETTSALQNFNIPGWDLQAEAKAGSNVKSISTSGYDSSSWYKISARSTVFAGLIEAGVYNTQQLFYSKNLQDTVDYLPYYAPWFYRSEFDLQTGNNGSHFFLITNGITSKADIYLNGRQIANSSVQAGAYGGHVYDVSKLVRSRNGLLVRAYPTLYDVDFGQSWVDWNSYPPDNGTGVWRDVSIKQTGPLLIGPLRIVNDYTPGASRVTVTLRANVTNLESSRMQGVFQGMILDSKNGSISNSTGSMGRMSQTYTFGPLETKIVEVNTTISNPQIWWPKQWGDQPLYTAQASILAQGQTSDQSPTTNFGIRHITSKLQNHYSDLIFYVNGYPFQVRGGGYAPDLFLRWNSSHFEAQAQYVLDMGMNTIRLEGKMEQPELYDIADRMGLMILPGWECCDKWEAWAYNDEVTAVLWNPNDYVTASMMARHEASWMQTHPSMLGFLIGSDYWPNSKASALYIEAFDDYDWQNPIVCSAAKRGYVKALGPSGMKMTGPYDWVPPDYWWNGTRLGSAFGFGSELGAGVGTPEIGSLTQFLSSHDLKELWTEPFAGLYHMSTNISSFHFRTIYNKGLYNRYGTPTSLDDYLLKAQIMDYEATRSQFEAYAAKWNTERPATGLIYWMLNNAWPSLHWNQFDYYLHPGGSYFGTKVGCRIEHVAYDYIGNEVYLINQSLNNTGRRTINVDLIDSAGNTLWNHTMSMDTEPNSSKVALSVKGVDRIKDVAFLRLLLTDSSGVLYSRNVYWLATSLDQLEWHNSTWYSTPVSSFSNYKALMSLTTANVSVDVSTASGGSSNVMLQNHATTPAFFIRLNLVDGNGDDVVPVIWSDNYVTLFPGESMEVSVSYDTSIAVFVETSGANFGSMKKIAIKT